MQIFKKAGNGGGDGFGEDEDFGAQVLEAPDPLKLLKAVEAKQHKEDVKRMKAEQAEERERRRANACCICGC